MSIPDAHSLTREQLLMIEMVPRTGLEPACFWRSPLKRVCLPIPPPGHSGSIGFTLKGVAIQDEISIKKAILGVLQPLPRINLKRSPLSSDWVLGSSFQRSRWLLLPAILS